MIYLMVQGRNTFRWSGVCLAQVIHGGSLACWEWEPWSPTTHQHHNIRSTTFEVNRLLMVTEIANEVEIRYGSTFSFIIITDLQTNWIVCRCVCFSGLNLRMRDILFWITLWPLMKLGFIIHPPNQNKQATSGKEWRACASGNQVIALS